MAILDAYETEFELKVGALPRSDSLNIKFQGGGWSWRDKIGLFWSRGNSSENMDIYMSFSSDAGLNWYPPALQGITGTDTYAAHIQMIYNDRWAVYSKGNNGADADPYRLWTKPIPRYDVRQANVKTTNGSNVVEITWTAHGLKTGDKIRVDKFENSSGGGLNGITLAALRDVDKSITVVNRDKFSIITDAGEVAGTGPAAQMFVGVRILDTQNIWTETKYALPSPPTPVSFGRAIIRALNATEPDFDRLGIVQ